MAEATRSKTKTKAVATTIDALAALEAEGAEDLESLATFTIRDEVFHVRDPLPPMALMRLAGASDKSTPQSKQMAAIVNFLDRVVVPAERDRYLATLDDSEPPLDYDEITEILSDVVESVSGRPTE